MKNAHEGCDRHGELARLVARAEQKALLGDAPWIFRKFFLGVLGAGRMRRYRSIVYTPSIAV